MVFAEEDPVDACVELKRLNVGKKAVEELASQTLTLRLVEAAALVQVPLGLVEDEDPHDWPESRFLAASQSEKAA